MKRIIYLLPALLLLTAGSLRAQNPRIDKIEPLSWWTGMNLPLQVMFYGENIGECDVKVLEEGLAVNRVHRSESPNYLFADVEVKRAGEYTFELSAGRRKATYTYRIEERSLHSRERKGFSSADLVYLIMPDRFVNGDPSNDATPDTQDKPDRKDHFGRHGGDIQGVIDRLDYLAGLGVTALWSTPMLLDNDPESSYHGYAAADYYRIDPRFGSNELYREMIAKGHETGIKSIMDMVPNHCGLPHPWVNDPPFGDWINFAEDGGMVEGNHATASPADPNASGYDKEHFTKGWFWSGMPDMNLANPYVLQYFKQWAIWWTEYAGLDGLRVDTFPYSDPDAIADWVKAIREEYPGYPVVGESWFSDSPAMTAYWIDGYPNPDGYNSNLPMGMDFPWMEAVTTALKEDASWNTGLVRVYKALTHDYLYRDINNLMIFLDNHDTDRIADILEGDPEKVKLALTMLATMRGIPQLYYGTELLFRSHDRSVKDGPQRIDFPGGFPGDPVDLFDPAQRSLQQRDVFEHTRKLFQWRKNMPVIHTGKTLHFRSKNEDNGYVYFRYNDKQVVMVVINNNDHPVEADWNRFREITEGLPDGQEVLSGQTVSVSAEFGVPAKSSAVVVFDRE